MRHFYQALCTPKPDGTFTSKAAAVQAAQLALLAQNPRLHPALWGAFQLMGSPAPLNRTSSNQPGATNES
jgi:CHAT domain-containing protein